MTCCLPSEEDFNQLIKQHSSVASQPSELQVDDKRIFLPRGGWLVETSEGNIQYSMVPETVKDCLVGGHKVPAYYICPPRKFDKQFCINTCEFEFPAYFSFFINKKKLTLICTAQEEKQIRAIFQETLLGPVNFSDFEDDFDLNIDKDLIPDIRKELEVFKGPLCIDMLLQFIILEEDSEKKHYSAKVGENVEVTRSKTEIKIFDKGEIIARGGVKVKIGLTDDQIKDVERFGVFFNPSVQSQTEFNFEDEEEQPVMYKENPIISSFVPPQFGLTILGSSHGFDAQGSTSGYIIWVGGKGILIDPPPFSTFKLIKMGIPAYYISAVILSHAHADHDAGVFQQLMEHEKIEIITTKTIMNSFLRKYSGITQMAPSQLQHFFKFRPAVIGKKLQTNGGSFEFYYALHSIPCIGFICRYGEKSIYFSGDTYYYPEKMEETFLKTNCMSQKRFDQLTDINFKFNHDLVLHEMGVPPIHTPEFILSALPEEMKKRIIVVHSSKNNIKPDSGLQAAKEGIENTYVLYDSEFVLNQGQHLMRQIDLITQFPLFKKASLSLVKSLIECIEEKHYKKGETIVQEGEQGDELFVVSKGFVKVHSTNENKKFERYFSIGNFFGEAALYKGQKRNANCEAETDCSVLVLKRSDFHYIFGGSEVIQGLENLYHSRVQLSLGGVQKNSMLKNFNSSQQIQIESILEMKEYKAGDSIWKMGQKIESVFLLNIGKVRFQKNEKSEEIELFEGALIAETFMLIFNQAHSTNLTAITDIQGFSVSKKNWEDFLNQNPGFYHFTIDNTVIL